MRCIVLLSTLFLFISFYGYSQLNVNLNPSHNIEINNLIHSGDLLLVNLDSLDINIISKNNGVHFIEFNHKFGRWGYYYNIPSFIIANRLIKIEASFQSDQPNQEDSIFLSIKSYGNDNKTFEEKLRVNFQKGKSLENALEVVIPERQNKVFIGISSTTNSGKFQVSNLKLKINGSLYTGGTGVSLSRISDIEKINIIQLSQVWGYIKYYYPFEEINTREWDIEFIKELVKIINDPNWTINQTISIWRSLYLKELEISKNSLPPKDWMKNLSLEKENKDFLESLPNRNGFSWNRMFSIHTNVLNPIFTEESYEFMESQDDGLKLLGLARFMSIIEFFYPYYDLIDKELFISYNQFIDKFLEADTRLLYELTILELLTILNDNHALIRNGDKEINHYWGQKIIPITVRKVNDKWLISDLVPSMNPSSLQKGDTLISINGVSLKTLEERIKPYVPSPNKWSMDRNISRLLTRTNEDELLLALSNGKKVLIKSTYLDSLNRHLSTNSVSHKILENNIGYINLKQITSNQINEILENFDHTQALIFDVRGYPKSTIGNSLAGHFIKEPKPFAKVQSKNPYKSDSASIYLHPIIPYYDKRLYLLINEETQSSAEFVVLALAQADKAKIIGSDSAGSIGNISEFYMPGGILISISGIEITGPNNKHIQRVGIQPDIRVVDIIETEVDELLNSAIQLEKSLHK